MTNLDSFSSWGVVVLDVSFKINIFKNNVLGIPLACRRNV